MKAFLISFFLTAALSLVLWQAGRMEAGRLRADIVRVPAANTPRHTVAPNSSDRITYLERSRKEAEPHVTLNVRQWAALDAIEPEVLATWVKGMKSTARDQLWQAAVLRWAEVDGPAAMEFALALRAAHPSTGDCACGEPGGEFNDLPDEVFSCWLRHDPAAALACGPSPRVRKSPETASLETMAQTDLSRALDLLAAKPGIGVGGLNAEVGVTLGNDSRPQPDFLGIQLEDPDRRKEFIRWLNQCGDEKTALGVFSRAFSRASHEGAWLRPERLPDYLPARDQLPATLEERNTAILMGSLAIGANPLEVLEHYNPVFLEDCVAAWAYCDPESAGLWLQAQRGSVDFEKVALAYIGGTWKQHAETAVRWAEHISEPATRLTALAKAYPAWHLRQSAEAEAWLKTADLSETHRLFLAGQARE